MGWREQHEIIVDEYYFHELKRQRDEARRWARYYRRQYRELQVKYAEMHVKMTDSEKAWRDLAEHHMVFYYKV